MYYEQSWLMIYAKYTYIYLPIIINVFNTKIDREWYLCTMIKTGGISWKFVVSFLPRSYS